jgi:pimeloyl-ACP methyl ester carboxylesterase
LDSPEITITRGFISLDWGQVHYRMAGHGIPLLLLHKTDFSSRSYSKVLPLLADGFRVIAPDLPGNGESDDPPRQWELERYAIELLKFLDKIGIDRFHIAGASSGAALACEIAASYPARVLKLVLFGLPRWVDEAARETMRHDPVYYGVLKTNEDGSHLTEIWQRNYPNWQHLPFENFHHYFMDFISRKPRAYEMVEAVLRYPEASRLPLILPTIPTLLVSGDADERFAPFIEDTKGLVPHAQTVALPPGSMLALRAPTLFASTIREFVSG